MAQIKKKNILVVAGDVSGDVHASALVRELKYLRPDLKITSVGGMRLKAHSDEFIYDLATSGIGGFTEPFKKLPMLLNLLRKIENYMDTVRPEAVIPVDYYGFNSFVLSAAKKRNIPVYYFIAPQVWASRSYRARKLAKTCKKIYNIYPFEPAFHKKYGGNAVFLGNPLMDTVPGPADSKKRDMSASSMLGWKVGLLPGSRSREIESLTPLFAQTVHILNKSMKIRPYLFAVPEKTDQYYQRLLGSLARETVIARENDYKERSAMDFLLTCSGTATLENTLLGVPMLVAYKLPKLTYKIASMVIKVPFISLTNILAGKEVVREFVQEAADPDKMAVEATVCLEDAPYAAEMKKEFTAIRKTLGKKGFSARVAEDIISDLF